MPADRELRLKFLRAMLHARISDETEQAVKRRGLVDFQLSCEGHEALAAVAFAMRPEDWLHPHYRDRPIVMARGMTDEEIFLDLFAKADGPSKGRQMPVHFCSRERRIVSLSTPVATNMLQAAGMALSLRDRNINEVVVATIGDAATREGETFEAMALAAAERLPVVFIVEDNGYGISTPTHGKTFWTMPGGFSRTPDGNYFHGCRLVIIDGLDPLAVYEGATECIERARSERTPSILIAKVERLKSHSSSDDQTIYRSREELQSILRKDPVPAYAKACVHDGLLTEEELHEMKRELHEKVDRAMRIAMEAPEPEDAGENEILAPLAPDLPDQDVKVPPLIHSGERTLSMARCIEKVFEQEMARNGRIYLFGEDIEDPKGDVFGVTRSLSRLYPGHVRNSPLAEATIIGTMAGRAILGDVAVACIQFVDFMGPGLNQLFNEVTTFYWRSAGQWNCPVVVVSPYGGYVPGVGPWHSQTNESIYAHVPGMHILIPSNPADAAGMLRYALRCNRPVLFLYPKKLLHAVDAAVAEVDPECMIPPGLARIVRAGRDATIVTWGNCVSISQQAAEAFAEEGGQAEILDLRSIVPWDRNSVLASVKKTGRLIVVHEDARLCGLGGEIVSDIVAEAFDQLKAPPLRVTKGDVYNPYNFRLELAALPSKETVLDALRRSCRPFSRLPSSEGMVRPNDHAELDPFDREGSLDLKDRPSSPQPTPLEKSPENRRILPIQVPRQSPTDEDAILVRFAVNAGDMVKTGQILAELEANKGTFEIESPADGCVVRLLAAAGERVLVQSTLIELEVAEAMAGARVSPAGSTIKTRSAPAPVHKTIQLSPSQIRVGQLAKLSAREIPQATGECEADLTRLHAFHESYDSDFADRHGFRPGFTASLLWCLIRAMELPENEMFRGRLSEDAKSITIDGAVNVGLACLDPEENLFAPIVREAQALTYEALAVKIKELTAIVREGKVRSEDLTGGTLTLTNIGPFGVKIGTPFVIPGQIAILAAGTIQKNQVYLRLAFDHRPVNGSQAARLLRGVVDRLEAFDGS